MIDCSDKQGIVQSMILESVADQTFSVTCDIATETEPSGCQKVRIDYSKQQQNCPENYHLSGVTLEYMICCSYIVEETTTIQSWLSNYLK